MKNLYVIAIALLVGWASLHSCNQKANPEAPQLPAPDADHGSIHLPADFGAVVVADTLGEARHLAVADNGDIYVRLRRLKNGKGIVAMRDTSDDAKADRLEYFADTTGTDVRIHNGYLYFSNPRYIFRAPMVQGQLLPESKIDTLIEFPIGTTKGHSSKSFTFDNQGNILVNIGSMSNACESQLRTRSPGINPCPELPFRAAIWKFKADKIGQTQEKDGTPYAIGIRNTVGLAWNSTNNKLYATQHGRDDLFRFWPEFYTDDQSREIPSEEFLMVEEGDDFGWPYCYYDHFQNKKMLAPEYGGDGKVQGKCEGIKAPIVAFPGHMAPNDLLFYTGDLFPARYKNGAFIAFHGSWNRINYEQAGFMIAFVPMENGLPSGPWEVFADGFTGPDSIKGPGDAEFRPCGLAQGPDGSLYVVDSRKGRVWRILYYGENSGVKSEPEIKNAAIAAGVAALTPEMAQGKEVYDLYCKACHMDDGKGVQGMNPPLANTDWVTGDKTRLINVVLKGLSEPVVINGATYQNAMASFAGLSDEQIARVLTYVRGSFGNTADPVTQTEVAKERAVIQ